MSKSSIFDPKYMQKSSNMAIKNLFILFILGMSNLAFSQTDSLINVHPSNRKDISVSVNEFNISADLQILYFSPFEHVLGKKNVQLLSTVGIFPMFGFSKIRNKKYFSFRLGYSSHSEHFNSNTDASIWSFQSQLDWGYSLIDVKRWRITPKASIKWMRFTLDNHDSAKKIPLGQFVNGQRNLDIRFNQLFGNLGLRLDYKIYGKLAKGYNFITMGLYAGYAFGLHSKPLIRSKNVRLINDNKIDIFPWDFRMVFGFDIFH